MAQQTDIKTFYTAIRWMAGDNGSDATLFKLSDDSIQGAVRTAINMGTIRGHKLTDDLNYITPAICNPNTYALIVLHVVKMYFDPFPSDYKFKTRAVSESFGHWKEFIRSLESRIYHLENGTMFTGWMNYYTWIAGLSGLPLAQVLTELNINTPIFGQKFSLDAFPLPIDEIVHY